MVSTLCDNVTRLRNAILRQKETVMLRRTNAVEGLVSCLSKSNMITYYKPLTYEIYVRFRMWGDNSIKIKNVKMISKPSLKTFITVKELMNLPFYDGFYVLSTNLGWLNNHECVKRNVGGLLVCHVAVR